LFLPTFFAGRELWVCVAALVLLARRHDESEGT